MAFNKYRTMLRMGVLGFQWAVRNSVEWFEFLKQYLHLQPLRRPARMGKGCCVSGSCKRKWWLILWPRMR
jgi:hypothetical protein